MRSKNENIPTKVEPENDFNLEPENKRAALSTIKSRIKDVDVLLKNVDKLYSAKIIQNFDRLKIWIDLNKYGKYIDFSIGKNLIKQYNPSVSPYKRYAAKYNKCLSGEEQYFYNPDDEFDDECISYSDRKKIYNDCGISYDIFKKTLGINNVYIQNDILVIDITGKLMAEYGVLGLINVNNIDDCLKKLQQLDLFSFNIQKFLKYAGCYIADVTLDIKYPEKYSIKKSLDALGSFVPVISNDFYVNKYKKGGLLLKKKSQDTGCSFIIYYKGEEIIKKPAPSRETKPVKYREIIGEEGMYIAEQTLRFECHMYKMKTMRKLLNIPAKTSGIVSLKDVLNSREPTIFNMIVESGVNLNEIFNSLEWYSLKTDILENKKDMSKEDFEELAMAEWYINKLKENNYDISIVKKHIMVEYNIDFEKNYKKNIVSVIQKNIYNYLCFRKPKTLGIVLFLINYIQQQYLIDAKADKKPKSKSKTKVS